MDTEYPKNVICDFRKLGKESLLRLLKHYSKEGLSLPADISRIDLASRVAKIFLAHHPMELNTLDHFAAKHCLSTMDINIRSGRGGAGSGKSQSQIETNFERLKLDAEPARVGEQVAAKVSSDGEGDSWILVNVLAYDAVRNSYIVQDEDDSSNSSSQMTLSAATHVKRLYDSAAHLHKGDSVLAVFPDTTSFYGATVVRNPRGPGQSGTEGRESRSGRDKSSWEVVVKFDDDEDETGRAPPRRIPARFILLQDDVITPNLIQGAGQTAGNSEASTAVTSASTSGSGRSKKRSSAQMSEA